MAFDLAELAKAVIEVVNDEASFLAKYESNWAGVYGLPGRRESHLVAAFASHLRRAYDARCVLDDSLWCRPDTRCDLAVQVGDVASDRWAWIELKTMPVEDARDKLAKAHGDIRKLDEAAVDRRNLPQAIVIVGYDHGGGTLGPRLTRFARAHGLDRWSNPGNGVQVLDLPASPGRQHYVHSVVGVWARQDRRTKVLDCNGRCHLAAS
ncbi:hypothetical protein [Sorangium sp. So ce145]|uniref:hypothetical protein n=1 Tax=Sorangium sp. So ce145 TaxID=3133285 RepID=UPI003F5F726D